MWQDQDLVSHSVRRHYECSTNSSQEVGYGEKDVMLARAQQAVVAVAGLRVGN